MVSSRRTVTLVCALALAAAGCGATAHSAPAPAALTDVLAAATASETAQRMAFAAVRYRNAVFPSATSSVHTYATKPGLVDGQPVVLSLDVYQPTGDASTSRPLLVWIHGGGFTGGNRSMMADPASEYARIGYLTATISYRLDPGSKCTQVQAGLYTGAQLIAEQARCERVIIAARDDAASAIAWLRANAAAFGIDTTRVAVGGSSAGAITALHVGQTLNTPGSPPPAEVRVSAVLAMSGCNYVEGSIDAADPPIAVLASGGDRVVPFSCSVATVDQAAALGTPVMRHYYELESGHGRGLYSKYQPEIDRAWRMFLIDHLHLA